MAGALKSKRRQLTATVDSVNLRGEGVTRVDGKVYFIDGTLPGELIEFEVTRQRKRHGTGKLLRIVHSDAASGRVEPDCRYSGICGGCSLRHYQREMQLKSKQQALIDALLHIGKVKPETIMPPISGEWLHYRRKARLGVRHVEKKGGALVGFREKNSGYITALDQCLTLTEPISNLLPPLKALVNQLSVKHDLPQIEVAQGDNQISLVFRHLIPPSIGDLDAIMRFSMDFDVQSYLQPKGIDSIRPCYPKEPQALYYTLDQYKLRIYFSVTDFVQVNAQANQMLLSKAIELLDPKSDEIILDLYCGLGNFSLPVAKRCEQVFAVEGDLRMVEKARFNAQYNQIENIEFLMQDLSDPSGGFTWLNRGIDKVLLDPARAGAALMCEKIGRLKVPTIVYASCNPATLARDADILVNTCGYRLTRAGIVNMFPHTAHVESIALFERQPK